MPGGFSPAPRRFGGTQGSSYEIILNDLNTASGTAITDDPNSFVYAYNLAIARSLVQCWSANQRMTNQFNPATMYEFIPRFEAILGIYPLLSDTLTIRRNRIAAKISLFNASATRQVINDYLTQQFPLIYLSIANVNSSDDGYSNAVSNIAGGVSIPGGVTLPDGTWSSLIHQITIVVYQPSNMQRNLFFQQINQIYAFLDGILPAWCIFDVVQDNPTLGIGWILDTNELDLERFSS